MSSPRDIAKLLGAVYSADSTQEVRPRSRCHDRPQRDDGQLSSVALTQPLPDILATILASNPSSQADATGDDETDVLEWVSKAGHLDGLARPAELSALNDHLISRTYLVANRRTAADVAVLGALHPWLAAASPDDRLRYPAVTRLLDLLQHDVDVVKTGLIKVVPVDVENVPKTQRTSAKAAAPAKAAPTEAVVAAAAKGSGAPEGAPTAKKEKKAKGGGGGEKSAAPADSAPRPSHIDLRVGKIVDGAHARSV
jgi:aminoacyl tRNA synthase complex-interacting multifunctional protein 1